MAAILFARPFPVTSFPGAGSRSGALVEHFRNISRSVVNGDAVLWSRKVIVFLVKYHMSYFEFLRISLIPRVKKRRPIQALRCVNTCAEAAVGVSVKHTHTHRHTLSTLRRRAVGRRGGEVVGRTGASKWQPHS